MNIRIPLKKEKVIISWALFDDAVEVLDYDTLESFESYPLDKADALHALRKAIEILECHQVTHATDPYHR